MESIKEDSEQRGNTEIKQENEAFDNADTDSDIEMESVEEVNNLSDFTEIYDKGNKKNKKTKLIISGIISGIIISTLVVFGGIFYYVYDTLKSWDNYVYPGVFVNGIERSRMTEEELSNKLVEENLDPIAQKTIHIKALDKDYEMKFSELNPQYNIDEVTKEAFSYKKDDTLINRFLHIKDLFSKEEKQEFQLEYSFDDSAILSLCNKIEEEIKREPVDATVKFEDGVFLVEDDAKGYALKKDELISALKDIAMNPKKGDVNIEAPLDTKVANVTGDLLKRLNGVMSSFTTSDSNSVRLTNMGVAARDLNGTLILPGETFSFNDVVGDSLPEKGYVLSYSYVDNKSVLDYGGGVCQVSTTLYGTLLRANIMPLERGPHMMPIWYVPMGLDAAVFYGVMDIKFKNESDAPLYIESYLYGQNLTITLYGDTNLMNGLTYRPYSVQTGPLSANAYLQTIDASGNVLEEIYLHSDTYNSH